jgi:hypothetical protein
MQVSTRAYYAWTKQPETTEKTKENEKLETEIGQIFDEFKQA